MCRALIAAYILGALAAQACFAQSFVNWESPHVSPLAMTPDGAKLLAVNTPDNRLEVFDITARGLHHGGHLASVPVGLDPVSVRARTNTEAWVVNRISGTISVVDLDAMTVVRTIETGAEPADVVFAGPPGKERAFVSVAELHEVRVFNPNDPGAPVIAIPIQGREPRMLTVDPDGSRVYVAIFESGSRTTILKRATVSDPNGPYGGQNPPPNDGSAFSPPIAPDFPEPPPTSLIVRRMDDGTWRDDNNANWSSKVTWNLHDHGVAIIDAQSLNVSYVSGTMNINTALAVNPSTGKVALVGTDAFNHVRFEPNLSGVFARVSMATVDPNGGPPLIVDLNEHLTYTTSSIPLAERLKSIGDPRGISWSMDGKTGFVTGMGSNNVIVINVNGERLAPEQGIAVGQGPTGIVVDDARNRLYVLNRFEGSVSIVDLASKSEVDRVSFYDPTPQIISAGRPFLYNTHLTSGLGHVACATCHVDGRSDRIAWDLGDPQGALIDIDPDDCAFHLLPDALQEPCKEHHHPMKGPMVTQTLVGILDNGPMHWRGDRENLHAFDVAFTHLQGLDEAPLRADLDAFEAFIGTMRFEANPFRTFFDGFVPAGAVPGSIGNPAAGAQFFDHCCHMVGGGALNRCTRCHSAAGPFPIVLGPGTGGAIVPTGFLGEEQTMKTPHLRELRRKLGFNRNSQMSDRGFGFLHDGSDDTLFSFFQKPGFIIFQNNAQHHFEAFLLSFPTQTHPAIGAQVTIDEHNEDNPAVIAMLSDMQSVTDDGPGPIEGNSAGSGQAVSIVAKGLVDGEQRGYAYIGGGVFQSDRAAQTITLDELRSLAGAPGTGNSVTFTVVPFGSEIRIGIDRDEDGYFDHDELDAGSDPANPLSTPGDPCPWVVSDLTSDCAVGVADLLLLLGAWGQCADCPPAPGECPADLDGDCAVGVSDLLILLSNWG